MAFTSSDSFEASYPSDSRRRSRLISSSLVSCPSIPPRSVVRRQEYDGSLREHLLRYTGQSGYGASRDKQRRTTDTAGASVAAGRGYESPTRRKRRSEPSTDIFELPDDSGRLLTVSHPPVTITQGVDISSIPLDTSSRRTTIFVGHSYPPQVQPPPTVAARHDPGRRLSAECISKMHRPVEREDYLVARGANSRTGIVTPGYHSANSSLDRDEIARTQGSVPPNLWRQKGDEWVSFDHDQSMPFSTHSKTMLPEPHYYKLRTPTRLSTGIRNSSEEYRSPPSPRDVHKTTTGIPSQNRTATYDFDPRGRGTPMSVTNTANLPLNSDPGDEPMVRRRPVGSPPAKTPPPDRDFQGFEGNNGSDDTILKKPRFNTDLRSSSAPIPPRLRIVSPYNVDKDLPTLPGNAASPAIESMRTKAAEDSFLDQQMPAMASRVPKSETPNTSGRPLIEKELPCLPMNSGQSPLIQASTPPGADMKESSGETFKPPSSRTAPPQGPRGGDPAYPNVRIARPPHHTPTPTKRPNAPMGERMMAIPVYDNPPKHPSSLTRMTGPKAEGPRSMPDPPMKPANRLQEDFNPLLSTTTTRTDMYMSRPNVPRPLRIGPRPLMPQARMMGHGRHGLGPRPPPLGSSDIIMNTGMFSNTDSMISAPLPRIRPRAMTRPQMPVRADGMYGVPTMGPNHNRANTTGVENPQLWRDEEINPMIRLNPPEAEPDLVPPPLKLRQPSHELAPPQEILINNELTTKGLGLLRKCSRCHHGFVDVKPRSMDSVTPMSGRQKDGVGASEVSRKLHPTGSPLPGLPEDIDEGAVASSNVSSKSPKADVVDERDHTICCPDCCKDEDCHEGCLGHPSPTSTPSPTKSIWSASQSPSSASEVEEWEYPVEAKTSDRGNTSGLAFSSNASTRPPKNGNSKHTSGGSISPIELSAQPRTPGSLFAEDSSGHSYEAVAAARKATGSATSKQHSHGNPRRQMGCSSPVLGVGLQVPEASGGSQGPRTASGSRLRVPTPVGLAIACSEASRSRNVSGTSISTLDLSLSGLGSLAYGNAVGELLVVPFQAAKMWIQTHPQVTKVGWDVLERAWQMGQTMTITGLRLWAVVLVYSKTGKLKLKMAKGETAGGFVVDCARSFVYLLMFMAVTVFVIRVVRFGLGVAGIIGLLFKAVFWILKQVLGFGLAR
ncbi:hypothetical protein A1O1_03385 [Capronia coronata CBS 617.96]|uniref:Uncharacterized protein n=1 Tax=Capronia coronata CBS 617.96 TaxID=1182541 RepID=W9YM19_9EURO|nr:uncharacterized protein A1O1_03385 [Capronia coronata CBS 617.96]EXJ90286.1 hypothetical protein A1O1_03385 [Capronia coronata CBS 617.96]